MRRLGAQVKEVSRQLNEMEQSALRKEQYYKTITDRINELEADRLQHVSKLESQLKLLSTQEQTVKVMEAQMKRKQKASSDLQAQIQSLQDQSNKNEQLLRLELEDKQATIQGLESQLHDYKLLMDTSQNKNMDQQKASLEATNQLRMELTRSQEHSSTLNQTIKDLNKANQQLKSKNNDLSSQCNNLDLELHRINTQYEITKQELNQHLNETNTLKSKQLSNIETVHQEYKKQLNELKNKHSTQIQLLHDTHDEKLHTITIQFQQSQHALTTSQAQHSSLTQQLSQLQNDLDLTRSQLQEKNQLLESSHDVNEKLSATQGQLLHLQSINEKMENENQALGQQLRECNEMLVTLKANGDKAEKEVSRLEQVEKESVEMVESLKKREKHLQSTLIKLVKTEHATQTALTCMRCMNLFNDPVVCSPCGHAYCKECVEDVQKCPNCSRKTMDKVSCQILEVLAHKCEYRKTTLESLLNVQ
ncbi:hypothetical protein AKO1_012433 [Acrasis kona]|uniref:RING-type domain-containing protein n=1 Tax=Acrasis kona TaxID=1008807 RepID=A0AAW2YXF6_9EUKA